MINSKKCIITKVTVLLSFLLTLNAFASGKLIQLALKESGLDALFASKDIALKEAKVAKDYIKNALKALNNGRMPKDNFEIEHLLKGLGGSPADSVLKRKVQKLFVDDISKVNKDEIIEGINSLIFLSNKYGKGNWIMSCGQCATPDSIFKYATVILKDKPLQRALKLVPTNPVARKKFIKSKLRGWDNYSSLKGLSGDDEKTLALFLAMGDRRAKTTRNQKSFIKAVRNISKTGRKVDLINPNNNHQLWKLVDADLSDKMFASWAKVLNETVKEAKGSTSKSEAFYKVLRRRAGNDPVLNQNVDELIARKSRGKGCYFK